MKFTEKQQAAIELKQSIISKCWEDDSFRSQLVANPVQTIESFTGKPSNVPAGKKLVVVDNSADTDTIYFHVPPQPSLDDLELSDEQLEIVAGGRNTLHEAGDLLDLILIVFF